MLLFVRRNCLSLYERKNMITMIAILALVSIPLVLDIYLENGKPEAEEEYVPDGR